MTPDFVYLGEGGHLNLSAALEIFVHEDSIVVTMPHRTVLLSPDNVGFAETRVYAEEHTLPTMTLRRMNEHWQKMKETSLSPGS